MNVKFNLCYTDLYNEIVSYYNFVYHTIITVTLMELESDKWIRKLKIRKCVRITIMKYLLKKSTS